MKQMGHTEFRPNIVRTTEAVEVTSHGTTLGYWIPKGSPEWDQFRAAVPQPVRPTQTVRLEPYTVASSPHDEARKRQQDRDAVLRRITR
jgi:hypothetical protein